MKLFFVPLMIFYIVSSCKKEVEKTYLTPNPVAPVIPTGTSTPLSYLALGDSYTIGQSVAIDDRFPVQTVKYLAADSITFNAPEIIAQTGWTTANLLNTLAVAPPSKPKYDVVTLLIGVNNQYQRKTQVEYTNQFSTLLNKSIQYAGNNKNRVIVLSIPDYSVTPFASGGSNDLIAREIDSFNTINKTIAMQAGVHYLDITGQSRLAANDRSLIANDGLHPSGLQYKLWAEGLLPIIKKALQ